MLDYHMVSYGRVHSAHLALTNHFYSYAMDHASPGEVLLFIGYMITGLFDWSNTTSVSLPWNDFIDKMLLAVVST